MQIVGSLLYYARTIDSTLLVALSDITSAQSKGTEETQKAARKLLDYCATHPEAKIRYKGSQMALHIHSDASYLLAPKARAESADISTLETKRNPNTQTCTTAPSYQLQAF